MPKNFYELEEVARALGISVEEVEEMISLRELPVVYTRKLPVVYINDYRWGPREAVDELLSELSPRSFEDPTRPFRILRSPEQEEADNEGDQLGKADITDKLRIAPDLLRQRIEELEGRVKALRSELEAERGHRAQGPDSERDDPVVRH